MWCLSLPLPQEAAAYLAKRFEGQLSSVTEVHKEDLGMLNHLSGKQGVFLQLKFRTVAHLMDVRKHILPLVERNAERAARPDATADTATADVQENFVDIREYDVPYYVRVSIDLEVRVGCWYNVIPENGNCKLTLLKDMVEKVRMGGVVRCGRYRVLTHVAPSLQADPRVFAFDIETTKAPLQFPDVTLDRIYMISYMFDGQVCCPACLTSCCVLLRAAWCCGADAHDVNIHAGVPHHQPRDCG